jgi:hypothetical protein
MASDLCTTLSPSNNSLLPGHATIVPEVYQHELSRELDKSTKSPEQHLLWLANARSRVYRVCS